ncbi:MAG: hypothetical protein ABIJ21_03900 [Nanoarchaeota archaeon]
MINYGIFCEVYGKTLRNLVLEYILIIDELDWATSELAQEASISRPKAYQIVKELLKEGIVKKSRIVAGTQLYSLNHENRYVKVLKFSFKQCLNLVEESPKRTQKNTTHNHQTIEVDCI